MYRKSNSAQAVALRNRFHRTTAEERAGWLTKFLRSGQTRHAFAAAEGLTLSTVQRWFRQARRNSSAPQFREVQWVSTPVAAQAPWEAEFVLPSGVSVRLRGELARTSVAAVLPTPT